MRASMFGSNEKVKSSETVLHLVSRGADLHLKDKLSFNCLHYATIKNNEETVNLLLTLGLDANVESIHGLKPFHLALYQSNFALIKLLAPITNGINTKLNQRKIKTLIKRRWKDNLDDVIKLLSKIIVIFCFASAIFWAYPQYAFYYFPATKDYFLIHFLFLLSSSFIWMSWYKTLIRNPGYLEQNTSQYFKILTEKLSLPSKSDKNNDIIFQDKFSEIKLCHICKTIQPLRSKHCRHCQRCIARFDHHCIYLGTCIGEFNRVPFFNLISNMLYSSLLFILIILITVGRQEKQWTTYHIASLSYCLKILMIGGLLTICTFRRAAINLTTNEDIRKNRYHYLWSKKGKFFNPFDKGSYVSNLIEHFKVQNLKKSNNSLNV